MLNKTEQPSKKDELMDEILCKRKTLMNLEDKLYQCTAELDKNMEFMLVCKDTLKIDVKKKDKFIKSLEKTEKELQGLRNLIIKQNELKKISPAEFEEVFEQTKIQMNIRKNDLKKKVKDLERKIEYCENEPKRNIKCLEAANYYLTEKTKCLVSDIEKTEMEIEKLMCQLSEMNK